MSESDILHELKELYHWQLDREPVNKDEPDYLFKVLKKFDVRRLLPVKNGDISDYYNSQLPWQFAVSDKKRTLLAILVDKFLEIRHIRDEYQKPIGRTPVPVDENPKWRKLVWSSDGAVVAFSSSNGELVCYNTLANLICSIPKADNVYDSNSAIPNGAAVSLIVLDVRTKSAEWPYELIALDFYSNLRSFLISSTEGFQPYHTFSFGESIVSAVQYVPVFNIFVIASPVTSIKQKNSDDVLGLSTWRILNDHPYYRLVKPSLEDLYISKPKTSWISIPMSSSKRIVVLKMSVSSNGKYVACLYSCGEIIIWTVPQLSIHKSWLSPDLIDLMNINKSDNTSPIEIASNILLDLNWCSDSELAILLKNGSLVVSGIDEFTNLLAEINPRCHTVDRQPEQLDASAKITNFCDIDIGFLLLNCKLREFSSWRRESESSEGFGDARHEEVDVLENHSLMRQILRFLVHFEMFHQQRMHRYVERIYSLMVLKKITAAELYEQKINNADYEEALDFARLFNLDENRVYKTQWNNTSPVTVESIENFLLKITDKAWILRECCERIPETLSAAKALLDYGLHFTDFNSFLNCGDILDTNCTDLMIDSNYDFLIDESVTSFSKSQLLMMQLRKLLLLYLDALTVYKEIIKVDPKNKSYDGDIFKKIRNEAPFNVALYFAREGNAKAVAVMFQYYGEVLSPFWFHILDDIPESSPPSNYKELLPRFTNSQLETWPRKSIRELDWSESGEFKDLIKLKSNFDESAGAIFPFSEKVTAEWYESKVRKIIKRSGLIDYALELVNLAIKNNISGLEFFKHNLLVLDTLMYELLIDNEISLDEIEKMSQFDQLMLLMSHTTTEESFLENVSNVLLPFLSRCENLIPNSRDELLNNYLKHLSKYDLHLPLMFFIYVSEKHEQDLFFSDKRILELGLLSIYACQRVDQIDMAIKIIQHLPECSDNNNSDFEEVFNLHSQLTELQLELDIMQLLQSYGIEKAVGYLHDSKNNVQFQKDTLTAMVNTKINSRLLSREAINTLLDDMAFVQENFFSSLPNQSYLRIFAYTMLTIGRVDCIEEFAPLVLTTSYARSSLRKTNVLSYDESVAIIIEAAQSYFNMAFSYNDPNISLAESCLSLIDSHADVERERKLINVLKELYDLGVQIPPLKIRMTVVKTKIIEKVLKVKPKAYKSLDRLISLAKNLDFDGNSSQTSLEFDVLNCAVDAAFQANDYAWCSWVVNKLMNDKKSCWQVCKKLCECEAYDDLEAKQKLIKLVLIGCSDKELVNMVELRNDIERKILEKRLQNSIQQLQNNDEEQQPSTSEETLVTKPAAKRKISTKQFPEFDKLHELISIPSFVSMLHSSSSNVLDTGISLWKNAFTFRSKDNMGEIESNLNADCAKLGFPEFYRDVHERCKCICFLDKKSSDNETQILQLLLRYHLLSQGRSDDVSNAITTNIDDVIAQLCARTFPRDCFLCLCLLLLLHDDLTYSEKIFETLPTTLAVEKFALFYYSIKVLLSNKMLADSWFENTPFELVKESENVAKHLKSPYANEIDKFQNLISKRKNVIQLEDLGCGIDSVRFFSDEIYKTDSILGLAMYEERDKLDLALSLGAEYGVGAEDIVLSHISSLFLSHNVTVLSERLKEPVVLDTLKQKSKYAAERIITDIYGGLYGCDYQILILYYALLNQLAENDVIHFAKPRDHMKMLRKLKTFSKTIDYKLLTTDPPQLVDAIFPSLSTNEANNALNFLISLPPNIMEAVSLQNVFETLFQKSLNSKVSKETIEKLKNYLKRFARIEKFNEACQELDIPEKYFREMQIALKMNDNKEMERIVSMLVLEPLLTTDVLRIVLEFVPTTSLTDIITDLLKKDLHSENIKLLLQRIESCLEDNEYEKCWCNSLKLWLTKSGMSETVSLHVKKILSILELKDDEIYSIIELLHETRLTLREWVTVHSRITIFDVATASSRLNLIRELLHDSSSFVQLTYLAKLLIFWPSFGDPMSWNEDPWLLLMEKILCRHENYTAYEDEFKLVQKILVKRKFKEDIRRAFFKHIENGSCDRVLLVCFCVLSKDDVLIQLVHHDIATFRQKKQLPKTIEEYIEKMQLS